MENEKNAFFFNLRNEIGRIAKYFFRNYLYGNILFLK